MKRSRLRWIDHVLLAAAVATVGLLVVPPLIYPMVMDGPSASDWAGRFASINWMQALVMSAFIVVWFAFLGSCFASFLNVVAWRVPRGRSINGSSHCPNCDGKLSMRDNVPVYGWVRNGGQCRHCESPISPRYLIVEVVLGLVTLLLISVEVFAGAWNLPNFVENPIGIVNIIDLQRSGPLLGVCAFHLTLVYTLFTFAVIRSERLRLPLSIFLVALAFGFVAALLYPPLVALGFDGVVRVIGVEPALSVYQQGLTVGVGLGVGLLMGTVIDRVALFSRATYEDPYHKDLKSLQAAFRERQDNETRSKLAASMSSGALTDKGSTERELAELSPARNEEDEASERAVADEEAGQGDSAEVDPARNVESLRMMPAEEVTEFADENGDCVNAVQEAEVDEVRMSERQESGFDESISEFVEPAKAEPTLTPYPLVTTIPEATACLGLIGLFLGWQVVLVCVGLFVLFILIRALLGPQSWLEPISSQAFFASIIAIICYRWIAAAF